MTTRPEEDEYEYASCTRLIIVSGRTQKVRLSQIMIGDACNNNYDGS